MATEGSGTMVLGIRRGVLMGAVAVLCALVAWQLWAGFAAVPRTSFRSPQDIVATFMNAPIRLLLPVGVALIAGAGLAAQLGDRFVASTRARVDIRRYLARRAGVSVAATFGIFFVVGIITAVSAYYIAPAVMGVQYDPEGYGLHSPAAIMTESIHIAPLTALLQFGPVAYIFGVGAWLGLNAAVLALVTVAAVLLIRRQVVALVVPFLVYMLQSVIAQHAGAGGASLIISAAYPSGMQNYALSTAAVPAAVLGVVALAIVVWRIVGARTDLRFS